MRKVLQSECTVICKLRASTVTSTRILLVYGFLKRVHIALAAVKRSPGDVHTHRVDTNIV